MTDSNTQNTDSTTPLAPKRTPLYQSHVDSDGKLVDFSGWDGIHSPLYESPMIPVGDPLEKHGIEIAPESPMITIGVPLE